MKRFLATAALSEVGLVATSSGPGPETPALPAGLRGEEEEEELELASGLGSARFSSPFFRLLWLFDGLLGRAQGRQPVAGLVQTFVCVLTQMSKN